MQKEKQLVPKLRFPEFEGDWDMRSLSNLTVYIKSGKSSKVDNGIFKLFGSTGIIGNTNESIKEGDYLLIARVGANAGQINLVSGKFGVSDNTLIVAIKSSMNIEFIKDFLIQFDLNKLVFGSGQPLVTGSMLKKLKVRYPTLPEQQKIANFLSAVDTRIQNLEKKKELLEQYKKGITQKIFKQEIRFKDDNGKAFPEWENKKGNLLFASVSNKNHNSDLPILAVTQDQGAIPRDLINYNIGVTPKSVRSYKIVEKGDFIISLRSFQGGIEYSNYKGICSPAYIILRPKLEVDRDFYKYYFKTSSYIIELNRKLEGIRDGKMISYKYFSEIKLPFPSLEEQKKIANFLSAIDQRIILVTQQIAQSKTYKKGLLQQMFV